MMVDIIKGYGTIQTAFYPIDMWLNNVKPNVRRWHLCCNNTDSGGGKGNRDIQDGGRWSGGRVSRKGGVYDAKS